MNIPMLIGVSGGSGSGKSTIVNKIFAEVPEKSIAILEQDSYYKDYKNIVLENRLKLNMEVPDAFDDELLTEHIEKLKFGHFIEKPIFDHKLRIRKEETEIVESREIVIIEGLMILNNKRIRELLDIKIFVDTEADIRLLRLIMRDMSEREKTLEDVISQYVTTVRPAHEQFIEPTKKYADIIVTEGGNNLVAIDLMVTKIKSFLHREE